MKNNLNIMTLCKKLFVTLILLSLWGCADDANSVYENLSFAETKALANKRNIPFCIIVSDAGCGSCSVLKEELNTKYRNLNYKVVFNTVDTNQEQHEWFKEWLYTPAGPIACIFSGEGNLVNIVAGANSKSIQAIEKAIDEVGRQTPLYYNSPLIETVGIKDVVALLDNALKCKFAIDNGEDVTRQLEEVPDEAKYPFGIYLKCLNEEHKGNTDGAIESARQLLALGEDNYSIGVFFPNLLRKAASILENNGIEVHLHIPDQVHAHDHSHGHQDGHTHGSADAHTHDHTHGNSNSHTH